MADSAGDLLQSVVPFIYGGNTNLSYEQLRQRQAIATALASQKRPFPKNVGEGITALGEALGRRFQQNRDDAGMQDYLQRLNSNQRLPGQTGAYPPAAAGAPGAPGAPGAAPGAAPVPVAFGAGAQLQPGGIVRAPPPAPNVVPGAGVGQFGAGLPYPGGAPPAAAAPPPPPPRPGPAAASAAPDDQGNDVVDISPEVEGAAQTAEASPGSAFNPDAVRNRLAALYTPQGVAQGNPTSGAATLPPSQETGGPSPDGRNWTARQDAIGGIEAGGRRNPYATVGVETRGDRPYGRYGVMGANIPAWTEAALGRPLTPEEFLADPAAQDATFQHRFGQYIDKYGEAGAARAWFGGQRGMNNLNATDRLGTSINSYQWNYIKRLRADASDGSDDQGGDPQKPVQLASMSPTGTMSDAPPPGLVPSMPIEPDENPPTPTDIPPAPTQIAQAGGGFPPVRGGQASFVNPPLTPATPLPGTTLSAPRPDAVQPPQGFGGPTEKPREPDVPPIHPDEVYGYQLIRRFPGDPNVAAQAKQFIDYGASQRKAEYDRRVEAYKAEMAAHEASKARWETFSQGTPERTEAMNKAVQERTKLENEIADKEREQNIQEQLGGLSRKEYIDTQINPSLKANAGLPGAASAISEARDILNGKDLITGLGASKKLLMAKAAQLVPGVGENPSIAATERFSSAMGPLVGVMRQAISGGGNISDADVRLALQMSGGDISLDKATIERVLASAEKAMLYNAVQHQRVLARYAGNDQNRIDFAYGGGNSMPMERIIPQRAVDQLRSDLQKAGSDQQRKTLLQEFDQDFATPGIGNKVLSRR